VTGHGKSSTANSLCGEAEYFKTSSELESETSKVRGLVTYAFNDEEEEPVIIIDTPGFGDSKGRDTEHIANMVMNLRMIGFVDTFIITINSQDPRFNEQLESTIKLFSQMFSTDFFHNVQVCFTRFGYDKKQISNRKKGKSLDEGSLIEKMQDEFKNRFGCDLTEDQFAFIDNAVFDADEDEIDEIEQVKYDEALDKIMEFTCNNEPFFCKDIKEVMKEKDALQKKILELVEQGE
jgi:predicted RNA-binding protein with RPS1 domain